MALDAARIPPAVPQASLPLIGSAVLELHDEAGPYVLTDRGERGAER
jgi:hypothetical protein